MANAPLDKMLDVTIVLLEVMRSKKQTLKLCCTTTLSTAPIE
jgi:hypothetical protein